MSVWCQQLRNGNEVRRDGERAAACHLDAGAEDDTVSSVIASNRPSWDVGDSPTRYSVPPSPSLELLRR